MNIGEAAAASGVSAKMIRYYEQAGLIAPAARSASGYRIYGESDIHALRFIRRARDLGFTVERIAALMELWRNRTRASGDVKRIALQHVEALEAKMREIDAMAEALKHLARTCHGDGRPDCPILDELAQEGTPAESRPEAHHPGKGFGRLS